jgi:translation initiation factor IF-3
MKHDGKDLVNKQTSLTTCMMRSSKCMFSTAAALHRVFIAPIEHSQLQFARRPLLPFQGIQAQRHVVYQQRGYLVYDNKAAKSRPPRDDEIEARSVSVVDQDGKLHEPRSTMLVLASIDRKTHSLVTVVEGEPGVPPICKIMEKKAMRDFEKAQDKAKRKAASGGRSGKTIELNWAIGDNDLGHRLKKMKDFLGKGFKVEIILARKKKGKQATTEECEALLKRIQAARKEVEGCREMKPMEGKVPTPEKPTGEVKLYFEGPKQKKARKDGKEQEDEDADEDVEEDSVRR